MKLLIIKLYFLQHVEVKLLMLSYQKYWMHKFKKNCDICISLQSQLSEWTHTHFIIIKIHYQLITWQLTISLNFLLLCGFLFNRWWHWYFWYFHFLLQIFITFFPLHWVQWGNTKPWDLQIKIVYSIFVMIAETAHFDKFLF